MNRRQLRDRAALLAAAVASRRGEDVECEVHEGLAVFQAGRVGGFGWRTSCTAEALMECDIETAADAIANGIAAMRANS